MNTTTRTIFTAAAVAAIAGVSNASLVVDRGLPDSNLNNAAGSDRSNVAWGFNGDFLSGDDFSLGATGDPNNPSWAIDKLSVWVVAGDASDTATLNDTFNSMSLYLGSSSDSDAPLALSANLNGNSTDNMDVSVSKVTYDGGETYQGRGGGDLNIFQVDFMNLGTFAPDEYVFAVGGDPMDGANPFMHASNSALSGTPQDGADGQYRFFRGAGGDPLIELGGFIDSDGNGWDKSSDINTQVFARVVPMPTPLGLASAGLIGVAGIRRRRA